MSIPLTAAWYRFGATLRRRWPGYVMIVLLIGLVGGVALGAISAARRTQSSFSSYLAASNSSDLDVGIYGNEGRGVPQPSNGTFYRQVTAQIARLPDVERVASYPLLDAVPLRPNGTPTLPPALNGSVSTIGSINGQFFDQDRVAVTQGRLADPTRPDQFVATAQAAALLGWHVGEVVRFGVFNYTQGNTPGFGSPHVKVDAVLRISVKLTGIVVFQNEVVRDDVDQFPTYVLFTPALTEQVAAAAYFPEYALRLDHGEPDVAQVEREVINALPAGTLYNFHVTSVVQGGVQRAIKPEAIALAVFGGIAALAALLIAGLAIGRVLQTSEEDSRILRALGAPPSTTIADVLIGPLGAVVIGSFLAAVIAIVLSPLSPIGPVRQVDPAPGFAIDWTVLGVGTAVLLLGLGTVAVVLASRGAPHRSSNRTDAASRERTSIVAGAVARAGLPAPVVLGVRFALERGRGRTAAPVRSALIGAALAVVVVVATLTFASGLNTLVSNPSLYGWNWNDAINEQGGGAVPPVTGSLLDRDPDVAAWAGYNFADAQIDGTTVPLLTTAGTSDLAPPLLSGHQLAGDDQIVLGAATLAQLHKKVGDTVVLSYGAPQDAPAYIAPIRLVVVGIATLPAIGDSGVLHPSMGTGGLVRGDAVPASFRNAKSSPDPNLNGPAIEVVKLRSSVSPNAGLASLQRIVAETTKAVSNDPMAGGTYQVLSVQRPAEIVNYRSTGATPAVLAAGLAAGAVVALGLTLVASVRRRRRELALLKTFGLTQPQLAATVAWQSSVAVLVGVVLGVPFGIALGRWCWTLFAEQIYAVPDPTVPIVPIVLVAVGALVLANLVAALPGRIAARTPTALLLRVE